MPKFAANLTFLFTELAFLDRFKAARDVGFHAVEFMFPYDYKKEELVKRLHDNDLELILHYLPAGNWAGGERGIACHPDRIKEFRDGSSSPWNTPNPRRTPAELPRWGSTRRYKFQPSERDCRRQPGVRRASARQRRHRAAD